jgi:shikimate dehydrogenase
VLMELEPEEVAPTVDAVRAGDDWLGLGVTAPYKRVVAELVDEVEADAQAIGAVNNVVRTADARLVGINTDAPGFRAGVELAIGRPLAGSSAIVAGAGGAAHAVVYALLTAGAARVTIGARSIDAATALATRFASIGAATPKPVELGGTAFAGALAGADLAVNATTVGMIDPGMTIDVERLPATATVFDLVYVPAETPLLAAARARGLRAANGSEMLIAQAAIAFERWTGVGGMADVMRTAVAPLLADPTVTA